MTLQSGGYMVINQTEALVSIDINSGKATREHNIEDTALKTNLEASDEIARQLRLRDLAGLIVIDFIDMEEKRNNRVGRTAAQRGAEERPGAHPGRPDQPLRPARDVAPAAAPGPAGRLDASTCPHCEGRGIVRSVSSCALSVLRTIEEQLSAEAGESHGAMPS